MKSFQWVYQYVRVTGFSDSQREAGKLQVHGKAPHEIPDRIARWLLARYARDYVIHPALRRMIERPYVKERRELNI